MSKLGWVIILVLMAGRSRAQDYFVLIETDNRQPFYIRMGNQSYASSAGGHLILSQLKDSSYNITVGFPGQNIPGERFAFNLGQKDRQFSLRYSAGKGWGLYDLESQEWKSPEPAKTAGESVHLPGVKKDDAFSRLMAGVVKDTAVMYNTYGTPLTDGEALAGGPFHGDHPVDSSLSAMKPAGLSSPDSTSLLVSTRSDLTQGPGKDVDSLHGKSLGDSSGSGVKPAETLPVDSTANSSLGVSSAVNPDTIVKLSERKGSKSFQMVYTDQAQGGKIDTVVINIPLDTSQPLSPGSGGISLPKEPASLESKGPKPADTTKRGSTGKSPLPFINSDCHNFATDYDVDKLRVKMLEASKDEDRIQIARKIFKTKCFTTKQVRALSEVFTTDAVKFRFLETAYPFVSDEHFRELTNLLADPVYISKFRVMTGQQ